MQTKYQINKHYEVLDYAYNDTKLNLVFRLKKGKHKDVILFAYNAMIIDSGPKNISVEFTPYKIVSADREKGLDNLTIASEKEKKVLEKCLNSFIEFAIESALVREKINGKSS